MRRNRVLVYCRSRSTMNFICDRLNQQANLVITGQSPAEIKTLLVGENIDAVVLVSEGRLETVIDLLDSIRGLPDSPVSIVVMIKADRASILRCFNAGCSHFLENPWKVDNISEVLSGLLCEKRQRRNRAEQSTIANVLLNHRTGGSLPVLSRREKEILYHLLTGKSNREISQELRISEKTVKNHLWKVYRKFSVENRTQLFHRLLSSCPCMALSTATSAARASPSTPPAVTAVSTDSRQ